MRPSTLLALSLSVALTAVCTRENAAPQTPAPVAKPEAAGRANFDAFLKGYFDPRSPAGTFARTGGETGTAHGRCGVAGIGLIAALG